MDLNSLRDQVSNLTLYDIKAGVRKVQNAVMNYTEMESKVREATNNEPWGASTSLMQEIANGTHSYQLLNEIMPLIYKRFTDKSAEEWRQIYKSLQLLEFLIKNGSERVIDDARQHVSLLRMLRQFHYIDQNGKDQGVNVRNRAQEIAKLLSDVDSIRAERKKARANRNKAGGVEGGMGIGGGMSSGSRYGGLGSDAAYGGYRGEVYGDGGGFGGNTSGFQDTQRRSDKFEEYDEDEEDGGSSAAKPSAASHARTASGLRAASLNTIKRDAKIKKEPEQDLFEFGDEPAATLVSNGKAKMSSPKAADELGAMDSGIVGDDDFDDFQSATTPGSAIPGLTSPPPAATSAITSSTPFAAPQTMAPPPPASNINDLFASLSPTTSSNRPINTSTPSLSMTSSISSLPPPSQGTKSATSGFVSSGPNYYTSVPSTINNNSSTTNTTSSVKSPLSSMISPGMGQKQYSSTNAASLGKPNPSTSTSAAGAGAGAGADVFTSLWSSASAKSGIQSRSGTSTPGNKGPDLASMAKAQNEAAMWGTPVGAASRANGSGVGSGGAGIPPRPGAPTPRTAAMGGGQGQRQGQGQQLGGGLDDLLG